MSLTEEQLKHIAAQLSKPSGDEGINIANMMHDSNFGMTKSTMDALMLKPHDQVLELGHGNGKHIPTLLAYAENLSYSGLEISELMKQEAQCWANSAHANFYTYNGKQIPFDDQQFNKAMTVNTLYFWETPLELLNEVNRVLQTGGIFCIAFAQRHFMESLPFTQHGFELYDDSKFIELVKQSSFKLTELSSHTEEIRSKAGEMVERTYTVATLKK